MSTSKRSERRTPKIKDFVPLADLNDIVFGGWDIYKDNVYEAAMSAKVVDASMLSSIKSELEKIIPMKAVFDKTYVKNLQGTNVKNGKTKLDLADEVIVDIRIFQNKNNCTRMVMVWCGSTEKYIEPTAVHQSIQSFEEGLRKNDPAISPSMIYAYAAIKMGIPYANGAPNLTCDIPALIELSKETGTPIGGKDFKTLYITARTGLYKIDLATEGHRNKP